MAHRQLTTCTFALAVLAFGLFNPTNAVSQEAQPNLGDFIRSVFSQKASAQIATDTTLSVTPDAKVDEQLYLLRKLEFLYSHWPTGLGDRQEVSQELAALRHEFVRAREFAKARGMDDRLVAMYSDSLEMADRYGELLTDLGAIDRDFYRKSVQQTTEAGVDNFTEGFGLGGGLAVAGVEPITATVVIGGLAIKQAVAGYQQQQQLDEQRAFALERRANQYLIERSRLLGRIEVQAGVLAEKFGWDAHEVGFDQDEQESRQILAAVEAGDYAFLLQRAETLKKVRPRDPFVHAGSGELWAVAASNIIGDDMDDDAAAMREAAVKEYLRAVELIPAGKFHDDLRAEYLWNAAQNASLMLYHSRRKNELPITLANTALELRPRDPDGRIRHTKAFALARNGFYDDAITLFDKVGAVRGRDGGFHYDLACLLSMAGKVDESMTHLKAAWAKGQRNVRWLRKDEDLATLRARKPSDFAELTRPQWGWQIDYGFVWNDVVVQNKGDFPLQNVAVKATWKGADGTAYSEVYWADLIQAGGRVKFEGVFDNASKGKADIKNCSANIRSEEIRGVRHVKAKDVTGRYTGTATLMQIDGSDVKTSGKVTLDVQDAGGGKLRLKFSGGGAAIEVVADDLRDGFTGADVEIGSVQRIRVFFDGTTVYGWCQNATDAANGDIRAFWLDK